MSRKKNSRESLTFTPERAIALRLHRLASMEEIASFFAKLIWMVLLLVVLFGILFGVTSMKNNDMSPRISSGDLLLYYRLEENPRIQDVVVFQKDGKQYVGRIVARGGDSVEITEDARLEINGSTVAEPDIYYSTPRYGEEVEYPVELEAEEYFILCDYRNGAKDSRYFGAVKKSEILGKVITVLRRSGL